MWHAEVHGVWPKWGVCEWCGDCGIVQESLFFHHGELIVSAERMMGDESRVVYGFSVASGGEEIIAGRATVVLDISELAP